MGAGANERFEILGGMTDAIDTVEQDERTVFISKPFGFSQPIEAVQVVLPSTSDPGHGQTH